MADGQNSGALKSFGWDTLKYVPYRIFPVLFGFLGLWVYTRVFSPSDYGDYSFINVTIGLLSIIAYTWIDESNMRFFTPYQNSNRLDVYFTSFFFMLVGTLALLSAILAALYFLSLLPYTIAYYLLLIVGQLVVFSFFEVLLTLLRANRKATEASFYRTVSAIFYLLVSLALIYFFKMGIASILLGYIITNSILCFAIVARNRYVSYIHLKSFSFETIKEYLDYGFPLTIVSVFSWVLLLSDRYFIEYFRGSYEVGIYSAAFQLADYPISMVVSMMFIAAWPIIINTWEKEGESATKSLMTSLFRYFVLFAIPAFVGVTILSQDMIKILTDSYYIGYTIIPFVCLSKVLYAICWYLNIGLELKKKTLLLALLIGLSSILDIALNFVLVPAYGFLGAAISLSISYTAYSLLSFIVARRTLNWSMPLGSFKNAVISAVAMGVLLLIVKNWLSESLVSLVLLVALGMCIYVVAIQLTGEVKSETKAVKSVFTQLTVTVLPGIGKKLTYLFTGLINR